MDAVKRCCATCRHMTPTVEATWRRESGEVGPHFEYRTDRAPCFMGYRDVHDKYTCGSPKAFVRVFYYQPEHEGTLCDLWEVR